MRLNFSKRLFAKIAFKTYPCNDKNDLITVFFDIVLLTFPERDGLFVLPLFFIIEPSLAEAYPPLR